jgi:hypothetical protein
MAILLIEHNGDILGSALKGRVLIGRRSGNHVIVDDPAVSRIHAWIDTADQRYCVTDAGSRTGTFLNGNRLQGKADLRDGDRIQVGPARLTFRARAALPAGVSQLDFARHDAHADAGARLVDGGVLFDCSNCRAPLWIPSIHAGRLGKCRFCAGVVRIPKPARLEEHAHAHAPTLVACGVCQSPIHPSEQSTTCPDCALTFHADCWQENYGCSAYGCSQVNVLSPRTAVEVLDEDSPGSPLAVSQTDAPDDEFGAAAAGVAPEHALLAGSVLGTLLGALTFGVPALLALVACIIHAKRSRKAPALLLAAMALSVLGVVGGVAFSCYWWLRRGAFV